MKKYLLFACALGAAALTSCQDEEFGYDAESISYEKAFINEFGDVDPNQDWLGEAGIIDQQKALTRANSGYTEEAQEGTYAESSSSTLEFTNEMVTSILQYVPNDDQTNYTKITCNFQNYTAVETAYTIYPISWNAQRNYKTNSVGIYIMDGTTIKYYQPFWKNGDNLIAGNTTSYGETFDTDSKLSGYSTTGKTTTYNWYKYYKATGYTFTMPAGTTWGLYITGNVDTFKGQTDDTGRYSKTTTTTRYYSMDDLNPAPAEGSSVSFDNLIAGGTFEATYNGEKYRMYTFEDQPDCYANNDWNDIMFYMEGEVITIPYSDAQYRVMCEDLGSVYGASEAIYEGETVTSYSDIDFNDIVFDIFHVDQVEGQTHSQGATEMTITIQAVGGELPISLYYTNGTTKQQIGGAELHEAMGVTADTDGRYSPINVGSTTGGKTGVTVDAKDFTVSCAQDFNMKDYGQYFTVVVNDGRKGETIYRPFYNNVGKVPQAFVTSQSVQWTTEGQSIKSKYSGFEEWVNAATGNWNWYSRTYGE